MLNANMPKSLIQAFLLPLFKELLRFADSNEDAAWEAAEAAAMSFNPRTVNEFRLAARVALFNVMANRLTAEAGAPSLTPACSIRMHNCALTYVREADKAERRLEKLQAAPPEEETPEPQTTQAEPAPAVAAAAAPKAPQPQAERPIPAYKRLKQERRLAKQLARDTRLKAQAEAQRAHDPGIPFAA